MRKIIFTLAMVICTSAVFAQALDIYRNDGSFVRQYMKDINIIKIIQAGETHCPGVATVDYEGKTYNTVQINSQCWLQRNLDVGTRINGVTEQTNTGTIEKYCYGDNDANCDSYGGLYQWNEAMGYGTTPGARGICPPGWHIPTKDELQALGFAVEGSSNALKEIGQGTGVGVGTNSSGFSGLLAGYRSDNGGVSGLGYSTHFWSSSEYGPFTANSMNLYNNNDNVDFFSNDKNFGYSVRCLKD